jgi:hypothetical protein
MRPLSRYSQKLSLGTHFKNFQTEKSTLLLSRGGKLQGFRSCSGINVQSHPCQTGIPSFRLPLVVGPKEPFASHWVNDYDKA